jgi:Holliday junction resolvase-like predicted endonuclease
MGSKGIKATPAKSIVVPSHSSGQRLTTEKLSPALKSSWQQGLEAELIVLRGLQKQGYQVCYHRLQTPFAEVDLLMVSPSGEKIMIEVKKRDSLDIRENPIHFKQMWRLKRALCWLNDQGFGEIEGVLAIVDQKGDFRLVKDVFC